MLIWFGKLWRWWQSFGTAIEVDYHLAVIGLRHFQIADANEGSARAVATLELSLQHWNYPNTIFRIIHPIDLPIHSHIQRSLHPVCLHLRSFTGSPCDQSDRQESPSPWLDCQFHQLHIVLGFWKISKTTCWLHLFLKDSSSLKALYVKSIDHGSGNGS